MKLEFRILFFWLLTWGFWVPLEEPENFINWHLWFYHSVLHDFEMQVLGMVTVIYAEWLTCRYAIFNMECRLTSSHLQFCFLQTLFLVQQQVIKNSTLLAYFHDLGKRNSYIHDPWSSIFAVRELCQRSPHVWPPLYIIEESSFHRHRSKSR